MPRCDGIPDILAKVAIPGFRVAESDESAVLHHFITFVTFVRKTLARWAILARFRHSLGPIPP